MAAPTSTTSITGLRATRRGSSLANASAIARRISGPFQATAPARRSSTSRFIAAVSEVRRSGGSRPRAGTASRAGTERGGRRSSFGLCDEDLISSEGLSRGEEKVLGNRAERQGWKIGERADNQHRPHEQADEGRAGGGERAQARGYPLLGRHRSGDSENRHLHQKATDQHRKGERDVVEQCVAGEPGEG